MSYNFEGNGIKVCLLPPDQFDGTALVPHIRARFLAEEQPPLKFRTFYDDFSANPDDFLQIQAQLIKEVKTITEKAILKNKEFFRGNGVVGYELPRGIRVHKSDIINDTMSLFFKSPDILFRVADAFENPEIVDFAKSAFQDEVYCAGFVFGVFWYGIAASQPDQKVVCELNEWHKQCVEQACAEMPAPEVSKKKKRKKFRFFF